MYGRQERCIQSFGGDKLWKKPLGRSTHRWKAIKRILKKWDGEAWAGLI
jgi:hypothetical protein